MKFLPHEINCLMNYGPHDYRLVKKAMPVPKKNELLIRVLGCGICASDIHCFHGAPMFWGDDASRAWVKTPVTPGHEFFGEVVKEGEGALEHFGVKIGDRVIAEQIIPCQACRFCQNGQYWMCEKHDIYGFQGEDADGGMSEYIIFKPGSRVHVIPPGLSMDQCVLIEPFSCAIHAVQRASIELNDVVVLAGAGPLGLGMLQIIKLKTPRHVIVIDTNPHRLSLAAYYGADTVLSPIKDNVVERVKSLTGGYGCDIYIEATGNPEAVNQGLQMIRRLGRFVEFSVFSQPATVDWSIIGDRKELDILGSHLGPGCYSTAINLFERKLLDTEGIVTNCYSLREWKKAFEDAASESSIKVVLIPGYSEMSESIASICEGGECDGASHAGVRYDHSKQLISAANISENLR